MRVHKEMFARWYKFAHLLCAERRVPIDRIDSPKLAWDIAFELRIPGEAYHYGLNDNHIETALKRIFPRAWEGS